jgi:hypothetical protein
MFQKGLITVSKKNNPIAHKYLKITIFAARKIGFRVHNNHLQ